MVCYWYAAGTVRVRLPNGFLTFSVAEFSHSRTAAFPILAFHTGFEPNMTVQNQASCCDMPLLAR